MKNIKNRIKNTLLHYIDTIKRKFLKLLLLISLLLIIYPPRVRAEMHQEPVTDADHTDRTACQSYFNYYGININTRSNNGWARVIKNRNLHVYLMLNTSDKRYLNQTYECLSSISNIPSSKNFLDRGDQNENR